MKKLTRNILIGLGITLLMAFRAYNFTDNVCSEVFPYYKSNHEVRLTVVPNSQNLLFDGVCYLPTGKTYTKDRLVELYEEQHQQF